MLFETERLFTRKLTLDDYISFNEMQGNERVMKYIIGRAKTEKENFDELEKILDNYKKFNSDFLIMAIVKKDDKQFAGTCAIVKNDLGDHEIGYRFKEVYWGNGYGKEILKGLVTFSFKSFNLKSLVAHVNKDNYWSIQILDDSDLNFIQEYKEIETGDIIRLYRIFKWNYKI